MDILCFFIGIFFAYSPHLYLLLALFAILFIDFRYRLLLFFLSGLLVALLHQCWVAPHKVEHHAVLSNAMIEGEIVSLPTENDGTVSFDFQVTKINNHPVKTRMHLSWYDAKKMIHAAETWQFVVKIKKPRNFYNPGSRDREQSFNAKHIQWVGYIKKGTQQKKQNISRHPWLCFRDYLRQQISALAPDLQIAGVIEALTINHTQHISQEDWALFRRTGTVHLFGISGEHSALLFGFFFILSRFFWSFYTKGCLLVPAPAFASIVSFLFTLSYAFLAGFEPPVQRALVGCFLYSFRYIGLGCFTPWQVWRYALFGVLCLDPHAVFMQGFYFSFLAVLCLLLTHQRWSLKGYQKHLALQLSCLIGLFPLGLYWFSYGSINGFLANLFAIPLVGFLIVPLSLLLLLIHPFNGSWMLIKLLSCLIHWLYWGLAWIEHLAFVNIQYSLTATSALIALMGGLLLWILLPIQPFKPFAFLWCIIPLFPSQSSVQYGDALVQILDVGQGLAVSVRTQHHTLLYDTGDLFFHGSDMGELVIVPFYQFNHIKIIDTIVISHPDKDHRGGLHSIEKQIPVKQLIVNDPEYYHRGIHCHHISAWDWDDVHFEFLPIQFPFKNKNNNSCVLQISTRQNRLLLTGDIEKEAEDYLVQQAMHRLKSDILVLAHHGSKTSSTLRFLLETAPRYAIASLGFDNRFHFPHKKTETTLKQLGIPFYRTDQCGMITLTLSNKKNITKPQCYFHKKRTL